LDTLYFLGFCLLIAAAIVWGYLNDDYADFHETGKGKKFSIKKPGAEPEAASATDEKDAPKANLL